MDWSPQQGFRERAWQRPEDERHEQANALDRSATRSFD